MKLPTLPKMPMADYKRKVFRVAPFTMYHATDGNYWLEHDENGGMHLPRPLVGKMLDDFWKENF